MLKARFGDNPLDRPIFELRKIAPHGEEPALQLYTAVVGLFTATEKLSSKRSDHEHPLTRPSIWRVRRRASGSPTRCSPRS